MDLLGPHKITRSGACERGRDIGNYLFIFGKKGDRDAAAAADDDDFMVVVVAIRRLKYREGEITVKGGGRKGGILKFVQLNLVKISVIKSHSNHLPILHFLPPIFAYRSALINP